MGHFPYFYHIFVGNSPNMKMLHITNRRKRLPVDTTCRNCGAKTCGPYCHVCGQSLFSGMGQPLGHLIYQVLENAFAIDGKAPATIIRLITSPGSLSTAFRLGKIDRYVHPIKLFWMTTLIFFALVFNQVNWDSTESENVKIEVNGKSMKDNQIEKNAREYITTFAPFAAFFLIPAFALLLWLFFYKSGYYYMYHLVFTVHFHTFLFLFGSLLLLSNLVLPDMTWPYWVKIILFFTPLLYFAIASYQFYHPRKISTVVWKSLLFSVVYVITLMPIIILIAVFFAWIIGAFNDAY